MSIIVDIDKAEERAQRALDGMTYNRDQMARDTIGMVAELRNWRAAFERMRVAKATKGKFSESFEEVMTDVFGKR